MGVSTLPNTNPVKIFEKFLNREYGGFIGDDENVMMFVAVEMKPGGY